MTSLPQRAFRSWRTTAALNVVAVASSLAALTAFVFRALLTFHEASFSALSTFIVGLAWAAALRVKPRGGKGVRMGWVLSPVFACGNSMLCVGLLSVSDGRSWIDTLGMMLLGGALLGAILWIPALVLTLLFFGLPLARAQIAAARGLAGADRGEIIVGATSSALALIPLVAWGAPFEVALGVVAIACGATAMVLSVLRERARRAFVLDVEAGNVAQFRVEPSPEGKVLVRVTTTGMAYRVSDFVEEIATLSEGGEVVATSRSAL
jgi:hypothetical protein